MQCPVCSNVTLVMSERQGIEIDYCPGCRGVWLDRGELDKIIDKSAQAVPQAAQQPMRSDANQGQPRHAEQFGRYEQPSGYPQNVHYKKKKREGFLGELFDFD
ncbi:MAG: hypothetical protein JWR68_3108 [Polaromonas sp.]|nr:hypothetical protein [Polaromonas sp.]